MGRNSGSNRGTKDGGGDFKGKITNVGPLVEMTDPQMYKATKQAISRYHAVLGVRQREVKLADFPGGLWCSRYCQWCIKGCLSQPFTFQSRRKVC